MVNATSATHRRPAALGGLVLLTGDVSFEKFGGFDHVVEEGLCEIRQLRENPREGTHAFGESKG